MEHTDVFESKYLLNPQYQGPLIVAYKKWTEYTHVTCGSPVSCTLDCDEQPVHWWDWHWDTEGRARQPGTGEESLECCELSGVPLL